MNDPLSIVSLGYLTSDPTAPRSVITIANFGYINPLFVQPAPFITRRVIIGGKSTHASDKEKDIRPFINISVSSLLKEINGVNVSSFKDNKINTIKLRGLVEAPKVDIIKSHSSETELMIDIKKIKTTEESINITINKPEISNKQMEIKVIVKPILKESK